MQYLEEQLAVEEIMGKIPFAYTHCCLSTPQNQYITASKLGSQLILRRMKDFSFDVLHPWDIRHIRLHMQTCTYSKMRAVKCATFVPMLSVNIFY